MLRLAELVSASANNARSYIEHHFIGMGKARGFDTGSTGSSYWRAFTSRPGGPVTHLSRRDDR